MLNQIKRIITHPGSCHFDELCACALIMGALNKVIPISRSLPTTDELNDPSVACVDVGRSYDPSKNNFDHHQFARGDERTAFTLVADAIGILHHMRYVHDWVDPMVVLDLGGPMQYAEHLGMTERPTKAMSPIDEMLRDEFEKIGSTPVEDPLLLKFGVWILKTTSERAELLNRAAMEIQQFKIKKHAVVMWNHVEDWGTTRWITTTRGISVCITRAGRAPGWKVLRVNDAPGVNFLKLKDDPRIHFIHASGFVWNTKELIPLEELKAMIERGLE